MALDLSHTTAVRNAFCVELATLIDVGTAAQLEFQTSKSATKDANDVATIVLAATAFGAPATGVMTAAGVPLSDTSPTGGTVANFTLFDGNDLAILDGEVGTSGADINLSSLVIDPADTVTLTALTWTAPT